MSTKTREHHDILELVGGSINDARLRLGTLHEALGLAPLLDLWVGDCSAGMRQRIAIAAAFAGGHPLVILDEPFNWLNSVAIFDLREALRDMVDGGLTLITALHDLGMLASACTRDSCSLMARSRCCWTRTCCEQPPGTRRRSSGRRSTV